MRRDWFLNAAIDPSASRATTTGIRPTTVVRQSPGLAIVLQAQEIPDWPSNMWSCQASSVLCL